MKMFRSLRNTKGYSPIEILIAVAISMVVMGGVYSTFKGSTDTFRYQESMARLQENGRFAVEILNREMRMAGYTGCSNVSVPFNALNDSTTYVYKFDEPISGFNANADNTWTPTLDASIDQELSGSDVVVVRSVDSTESVYISKIMDNPSVTMQTLLTDSIGQFDVAMISDCESAAVFQVTTMGSSAGKSQVNHNTGAVTEGPGNSTASLGHSFSKGAQIQKVSTKSFFVRNNPDGVPALYMKQGTSNAVELIEGIESMHITYGESSVKMGPDTCSVSSYVTADAVADWNAVCSVRVGLFLRTSDQTKRTADTVTTYNVNGAVIGPMDDRFLRRVYSQTIRLRNRPAFGP